MKKIERRALSIKEINSMALNGLDISKYFAFTNDKKKGTSNKR